MRFGGGGRRKALINITSLIDVVFLLLLFFVVTSTFLERPGLDLTLPAASPNEVARRDEVTVELDEEKYVGTGAYLFASVLERFLGLYASINSFTQLVARTRQGEGLLKRWPPRAGDEVLV